MLFAWNEYLFAMVFTSGSGVQTLPRGPDQSDEQARHRLPRRLRRHGYRGAVPVVLLFFFGQRYIVKGLSDGIGK
ncbi:hypothetical protein GCM10020219_055790 [Nonomuraea dietziae]